jgi:hypothetical protein
MVVPTGAADVGLAVVTGNVAVITAAVEPAAPFVLAVTVVTDVLPVGVFAPAAVAVPLSAPAGGADPQPVAAHNKSTLVERKFRFIQYSVRPRLPT